MKAAVMYRTHAPLRIEDLDQDPPKQGEVRVRTMAAGLCASDHHVIEGKMTYPLPVVLGHEGAGLVEEVGNGVTRFSPGDRVILSFQSSCGRCPPCRRGEGNLCDTHRSTPFTMFDGTVRLHDSDGTDVRQMQKLGVFAESLIAPQEACQILPDEVPWESAALIGCAVTTGVGGVLNTPGIQPGDTIAIFGAGGVGLNAIQGARLLNAARIIVVDIFDHKLEFAYKFGATDIINSRESDPVEEIKVGYEILKSLNLRHKGVNIISCPSCARQGFPVIDTVKVLEEKLSHIKEPITLSIIGCVVNGPGEASQTQIGITGGGKGDHMMYLSGLPHHKVASNKMIEEIISLVEKKSQELQNN